MKKVWHTLGRAKFEKKIWKKSRKFFFVKKNLQLNNLATIETSRRLSRIGKNTFYFFFSNICGDGGYFVILAFWFAMPIFLNFMEIMKFRGLLKMAFEDLKKRGLLKRNQKFFYFLAHGMSSPFKYYFIILKNYII